MSVLAKMRLVRDHLKAELEADPRFREFRELNIAFAVIDRYRNGQGMQVPGGATRKHDEATRKMRALGAGMGVRALAAGNGNGKHAKHAGQGKTQGAASADGKRQRKARQAGRRPIDWLQGALTSTPQTKPQLTALMARDKSVVYSRNVPPSRCIGLAMTVLVKNKIAKETPEGFMLRKAAAEPEPPAGPV